LNIGLGNNEYITGNRVIIIIESVKMYKKYTLRVGKELKMKGFIIILVLLATNLLADGIPIPNSEAPVKANEVVTDPYSGIQVVTNQILLVFHDHAVRQEQEQILDKVNGKIIGGVPAKSIYQVSITNPDGSIDHINRVCTSLQKDEKVAYATPRFVEMNVSRKTASTRKGDLNIQPGERDRTLKVADEMSDALDRNKKILQPCYKLGKEVHGKIEFRIILSPEGDVSRVAALKSEISNRSLIKCLEYKIKKWQGFPTITGNHQRQVDFTFKI
jgi:hypothetical protein